MQLLYYCLNLKRRSDRRFVMERTIAKDRGIKLTFIEAADGRTISERRKHNSWISASSYAVNLTKRIALRKFLRTSAEAVVIFEDDIVLVNGFAERWNKFLTTAPDDWGMLFLGGRHETPPEQTEVSEVVRCTRTHFNHAWVVRRWCAMEIIRRLGHRPFVDMFSDQAIGAIQSTVPTYAPNNWLAYQRLSLSDNVGGVRGSKRWVPLDSPLPKLYADEVAVLQSILQPEMKVVHIGAGDALILSTTLVSTRGDIICILRDKKQSCVVSQTLNKHLLDNRIKLLVLSENEEDESQLSGASAGKVPSFNEEDIENVIRDCDFVIIEECGDLQAVRMAVSLLKPGSLFMVRGGHNNLLAESFISKPSIWGAFEVHIDGIQLDQPFWLYKRLGD